MKAAKSALERAKAKNPKTSESGINDNKGCVEGVSEPPFSGENSGTRVIYQGKRAGKVMDTGIGYGLAMATGIKMAVESSQTQLKGAA